MFRRYAPLCGFTDDTFAVADLLGSVRRPDYQWAIPLQSKYQWLDIVPFFSRPSECQNRHRKSNCFWLSPGLSVCLSVGRLCVNDRNTRTFIIERTSAKLFLELISRFTYKHKYYRIVMSGIPLNNKYTEQNQFNKNNKRMLKGGCEFYKTQKHSPKI